MLVYLDQQALGLLAAAVALAGGAVRRRWAPWCWCAFAPAASAAYAFTTLDALVLFVAVIAPLVAASSDSATTIGLGILKLVAIGYSIEFAFDHWNVARGGALVTSVLLALVAARGVLPM